jgi:hypothetical protein
MSTIRETPTISGLIAFTTGQAWGKWLWIPGLFFAISLWWFRKLYFDLREMVPISIPLSLLISPIGWGYDQVILLILVLNLLGFTMKGGGNKKITLFLNFLLIIIYIITLVMRIQSPNEVLFIWIPLLLGGIYLVLIINHTKRTVS